MEQNTHKSLLHNIYLKYKESQNQEQATDQKTELVDPNLLFSLHHLFSQEPANLMKASTLEEFQAFIIEPIKKHPTLTEDKECIRSFIHQLCNHAQTLIPLLQEKEEPIDAHAHICLASNRMYALLYLFPAYNGGNSLTADQLIELLNKQEITYGLDLEHLNHMIENNCFMQVFLIATGVFPTHGNDGSVIPKLDCTPTNASSECINGTINYRKFKRFYSIREGDQICAIIPATPGIPGTNVSGHPLEALPGKAPKIPQGKNTCLSEDGYSLLASCNGHITFKNNLFIIEPTLVISGDVNYGTGNIYFPGDIVIHGDIGKGFTVKAQGSITIHGTVESAILEATGDITIKGGMSGHRIGKVKTDGALRCNFIQNCTIYSKGSIHANSIVACDISCEDSIYAEGSMGAIISSTLKACKSIHAKLIGSENHRQTTLVLGYQPNIWDEKRTLQEELDFTLSSILKLSKDVNYLSKSKDSLTGDKLTTLKNLQEEVLSLYEKKYELETSILQLVQIEDCSDCEICASTIHPPTHITIGTFSLTLHKEHTQCRIYLNADQSELITTSQSNP